MENFDRKERFRQTFLQQTFCFTRLREFITGTPPILPPKVFRRAHYFRFTTLLVNTLKMCGRYASLIRIMAILPRNIGFNRGVGGESD